MLIWLCKIFLLMEKIQIKLYKRRETREINVGKVKVGGRNPISVQSMTNTWQQM